MWRRVWIHAREGKRGVSYALRWYGDDGRIHTKTVSRNQRAAEQRRRELESKLNSGEYLDEVRINLKDFMRDHLDLIKQPGRTSNGEGP